MKMQEFVWEYLWLLLGIKKYSPILAKNTPPYFDSALLVLWLLTLLQGAYLSKLSISRVTTLKRSTRSIFEYPIQEAKNPRSKWLGDHKSNAESKHIYCSLISIHYQLNIPHEAILSCSLLPKFPVQKFLMTHILIYHDTRQWKTSMVTLPPLQTEPHQGPHWHLTSTNWWSDDVVVNIPIQTLVFLPWLLFYKMIISQLELGLPV